MNLSFPIVTLDFETFFDDEYSLKKLTTEHYVRDPRFRAHGVAIRDPRTGKTRWFDREHAATALDGVRTCAVLCHHAHFDGLILAHHYGIRPRMWLDTMAMGRALLGTHISVSLESLARIFGLAAKTVPYDAMKGQHWEDMDVPLRTSVSAGACHDVDLTWNIFLKLAPALPAEEFALIDQTVRMFTEPVLVGDTDALSQLHVAELDRKERLLSNLGVTGKALRSREKFCALLEAEGVEIEYKQGKNGPIPAVAKDDQFMRDLQDDDDPRVAALAEGRLSQSSSIVQSRLLRLRDMSARGEMCVYLNYCGAHTKRFSGGDKLNWQNNPRNAVYPKCIAAGPGELCVVADASQIECRILNKFAGQEDVIERFRRKEDPYIGIASQFYGEQIYKAKDEDPRKEEMDAKRGTGKQLELSCGYGAGGPTIVSTAKKGIYGPPVFLTDGQGLQARDLYRETHPYVVSLWNEASNVLGYIAKDAAIVWRDILEIRDRRIFGPNGLPLIYETLRWGQWQKKDGTPEIGWQVQIKTEKGVRWEKMYGAKLVENVIQHLARVHTTQAWLRCARAGMRVVSMEHDKLIAVVRESEAEAALVYMQAEMARPPEWMPGIPLDSDGHIAKAMKK